jgi:hypothetical protein
MKRHTKLSSEEQQQQQLSENQTRQTAAREFTSVEEALRYDAKQVVVPPAVEKRLAQSIKDLPRPTTPWWRRIFKG